MRKSVNITLSLLLSLMIVWIGSGVLTMVCEHTGNVSIADNMRDGHCKKEANKHCMKLQVKSLSATNTAQSSIQKVHPIQISLLPQLVTSCSLLPLPTLTKASEKVLSLLWHSPPRQYLRFLTTLLIWYKVSLNPFQEGMQSAYQSFNEALLGIKRMSWWGLSIMRLRFSRWLEGLLYGSSDNTECHTIHFKQSF